MAARKPRINEDRTDEVLSRIWLASQTGQHPFRNLRVPQERRNLPGNLTGPFDHGLFLYRILLFMQGGIPSEVAFRRMKVLYEQWPDAFPADELKRYTKDDLRDLIKQAGLTHYNTRPRWWQYNSDILHRYWDDDPRNIFLGLSLDPNDCWNEIINRMAKGPSKMMGCQEKIASMGVQFFVDANLVTAVSCAPPIDFRQARLLGSTGSVWLKKQIGPWKELNEFRAACREAYHGFSQRYGIPMFDIGEVAWVFAGEMCSYAHGNQADTRRGWNKPYEETCGSCFLSDLCDWVAPQHTHYHSGGGIIFHRRKKRAAESPLLLDLNAENRKRCTVHRHLWTPQSPGVCVGCGGCNQQLQLPDSA